MSISYSGLRNYGKTTLPSVAGWGTNMNIIRDPPKSIHTRRIDKVGETSGITSLIDSSGSRACEAITQYARGVNQMVSVSYGQGGGNGGSMRGGAPTANSAGTQSTLPYKIMNGGAFRPPIMKPVNLLPLSRMPRNTTSAFTKKGFVDYRKRVIRQGNAEQTKGVKNQQLHFDVKPTATCKISTQAQKPFEVKYVIQNPIQISAGSGYKTSNDCTQQCVQIPTKEVNETFVQPTDVFTTKSSAIGSTTFSQAGLGNMDISTKDLPNVSYITPMKGYEKNLSHVKDIELQRNVPEAIARTNKTQNIYVKHKDQYRKQQLRNRPMGHIDSINTRKHGSNTERPVDQVYNRLPKRLPVGGFDGRAQLPSSERTSVGNVIGIQDTRQSNLNQRVREFERGRMNR